MKSKSLATLGRGRPPRAISASLGTGNDTDEACAAARIRYRTDGKFGGLVRRRKCTRAKRRPPRESEHRCGGNLRQEMRLVPRQRWYGEHLQGKVAIRPQPYGSAMASRC